MCSVHRHRVAFVIRYIEWSLISQLNVIINSLMLDIHSLLFLYLSIVSRKIPLWHLYTAAYNCCCNLIGLLITWSSSTNSIRREKSC